MVLKRKKSVNLTAIGVHWWALPEIAPSSRCAHTDSPETALNGLCEAIDPRQLVACVIYHRTPHGQSNPFGKGIHRMLLLAVKRSEHHAGQRAGPSEEAWILRSVALGLRKEGYTG